MPRMKATTIQLRTRAEGSEGREMLIDQVGRVAEAMQCTALFAHR